jgi:hypothetical protein
MSRTIKDIEGRAEKSEKLYEALKELGLLPDGYRPSVRLHGKSRDKRRTASFDKNWSPESDSISIGFRPATGPLEPDTESAGRSREIHDSREARTPGAATERVERTPATASAGHATQSGSHPMSPLSDLIRALHHAESRPGYEFVALKWFRDSALPAEGFPWAIDDSARQIILRDAIDKRLILTSKMPNPRSPQFPVTAIRLNRLMSEVKAILGNPDDNVSDFQPVSIRGESLSQTVLRDRR